MEKEFITRFNKIRKLISDDNLKAAFKNFSFAAEKFDIPKDIQRDLIVVKNELAHLEKDHFVLGLPHEQYTHQRGNKIRSLLYLIEKSEEYLEQQVYYNEFKIHQNQASVSNKRVFLRANNITKSYKHFNLKPINIKLESNSILAVIGKNASGKSTLLRVLAGEEKNDAGTLEYFGETNIKDWYALKKKIGYIPQKIVPTSLRLLDILKFQCVTHGVLLPEIDYYVQDVINKMDLENDIYKDWENLSGGYQMRFELAKTIIWRPQILIMDEPLANLDVIAQRLFLQDIRGYADSIQFPISVIITSQHIEEIESIADYVIFIDDGEVLFDGELKDLNKNRLFDYYEIGIPMEQHEKAKMLIEEIHEDIILVKDFFDILTIKTPTELNFISDVLVMLSKNSIKLNYFREITTSTRRLFSTRKKTNLH